MAGTAGAGGTRAQVADRLHSLAIHLLRRVAQTDVESGVTGPRLSVLSVLVLGGGARPLGALAQAERVTPPTMTKLIQAMEAEGLVARSPAPDDGRVTQIRATKAGEKILRAARERRLAALNELMADVTPAQLKSVQRAIEILEPVVRARLAATSPASAGSARPIRRGSADRTRRRPAAG